MSRQQREEARRQLSPRRKSTQILSALELAEEQLAHFGIAPDSQEHRLLKPLAARLYEANADLKELWAASSGLLPKLSRSEKVAYFNAKRFLCFQMAKILDNLQNPLRASYQALITEPGQRLPKGPWPVFDNVAAIFSSQPVICRTATYLYACTEWVEDAFQGKELMHEIYSRLMNPTSIALANQLVDVEAGALADQYFALNFNSGMAALDAVFSHLFGRDDIVLCSRNVYGGTWQLLHDWYARPANLGIQLEFFDGHDAASFAKALKAVTKKHAAAVKSGRRLYVFLESPCNPHGYVLDVPAISRLSHEAGAELICDATVGTPFLHPVLRCDDEASRPDFVVHSLTKDICGTGNATAGTVIARNERMFLPKGAEIPGRDAMGRPVTRRWNESLFWNVYYIKGAFLDADTAFEVLTGMRTLELRLIRKAVNTSFLSRALASHPLLKVHCPALLEDPNHELAKRLLYLGMPSPLFTFDLGPALAQGMPIEAFKRFFDLLEPAFGLQVSLGQVNTVVLCPALTSHSELSEEALLRAGISRSTVRVAVGDDDPRLLLRHLTDAAKLVLDPVSKGFSKGFPSEAAAKKLYAQIYLDIHRRHAGAM